jgi:hypothetical protein
MQQLKLWKKALNSYVIRDEPLTKYKIMRQIPMGLMGLQNNFEAVYQVEKKPK